MPPYRLANLTPDQMLAIENLEHDLGLTLVAYQPEGPAYQDTYTEEQDYPLDAILETYRTYDPLA